MVRIKRSYRIQVCGHEDVATGELPSDPQQTAPDAELCKKPLSPFIVPPRAQASKPAPGLNRGRCETQATLSQTLPTFECKPLRSFAEAVSVCLRDGDEAEQIEGAVLCAGGSGEDGGEAIAPEADDIAGEGGEIAQQGVEAVHREWFAPRFREGRRCGLGAFAGGLALRRR